MIKPLKDFADLFGANLVLEEGLVIEKKNRIYFLKEDLKSFIKEGFFYAGIYLGEVTAEGFMPSFMLLSMIAETARNKIFVDGKTEWLFICGRDVFKKGVTRVTGSNKKNDYVLVMNTYDECLGFGVTTARAGEKGEPVVVRNVFDLGDFLRREK